MSHSTHKRLAILAEPQYQPSQLRLVPLSSFFLSNSTCVCSLCAALIIFSLYSLVCELRLSHVEQLSAGSRLLSPFVLLPYRLNLASLFLHTFLSSSLPLTSPQVNTFINSMQPTTTPPWSQTRIQLPLLLSLYHPQPQTGWQPSLCHHIAPLQQPPPSIIINLLSLLAHLTAHSSSSGHTPPTLSHLFGPLLFGLRPAALPFHITYLKYLCATNAMEHVLLSFVHWQDALSNKLSSSESSSSFSRPCSTASLGVPTHLKD